MNRLLSSLIALSVLATPAGLAASVAINSSWLNNFDVTPEFAITDGMGVPLTNGTNVNGDGAIIELGYFLGISTTADVTGFGPTEFATFVPLTGPRSGNLGLSNGAGNTTMGDGIFGMAPDGYYTIAVTFDTNPGSGPAPVDLPTIRSRIGIRFLNGTTLANSTHYNIVTTNHPDWILYAPGLLDQLPSNAILDRRVPPFIAVNELVWQGAPFMTSIPIPEPTTSLLTLLGASFLARRRK